MDETERLAALLAAHGIHVGSRYSRNRHELAAELARSEHSRRLTPAAMIELADEAERRGMRNPAGWICQVLAEASTWPGFLANLGRRHRQAPGDAPTLTGSPERLRAEAESLGITVEDYTKQQADDRLLTRFLAGELGEQLDDADREGVDRAMQRTHEQSLEEWERAERAASSDRARRWARARHGISERMPARRGDRRGAAS